MTSKINKAIGLLGFALCLPLTAVQHTSSLSLRPQRQAPITSVSQTPIINQVMGDSSMSTYVLEYATDVEYARCKHLSKAWQKKITLALAKQLVLPEGNKLIDYINKLIAEAPENDPARLSVINALRPLALRTTNAGDIFLEASMLYKNIPARERICDLSTNMVNRPIITWLPMVKNFIYTSRMLNASENALENAKISNPNPQKLKQQCATFKQEQQLQAERLKPLLKKWRPYGVCLKLFDKLIFEERLLRAYSTDINFLTAPQIGEICPIAQDGVPLLDSSKSCYDRLTYTEDQRLNTYHYRLRQLMGSQIKYPTSTLAPQILHNMIKEIERGYLKFLLASAEKAREAWESHRDRAAISRLTMLFERLDKVTNSEYVLPAILREAATLHPALQKAYLNEAIKCLRNTQNDIISLEDAADECYRVARQATDKDIKEVYYAKQAHFLNRMSLGDEEQSRKQIAANLNAAQFCSNTLKKYSYLALATWLQLPHGSVATAIGSILLNRYYL